MVDELGESGSLWVLRDAWVRCDAWLEGDSSLLGDYLLGGLSSARCRVGDWE